ncbi:unnamed protein product [Acidithrix sp. C25]|nr:unnamed protein product [Acidithrix sp. C25]
MKWHRHPKLHLYLQPPLFLHRLRFGSSDAMTMMALLV